MNNVLIFKNACYYFKKITFRYNNVSYVVDVNIDDKEYANNKFYLLNKENNKYQFFDTVDEIVNNGIIEQKPLLDVLNDVKILSIDGNIKNEFIAASLMNNEIEFEYKGVNYFKSSCDKGYYIWCEKTKNYQYFSSNNELLKKAIIENKLLIELLNKIYIKNIF